MRILFSARHFYPYFGGGETSIYAVLARLAQQHEVTALCTADRSMDLIRDGITIRQRRLTSQRLRYVASWKSLLGNLAWGALTRKVVKEERPDVVISQGDFAPSVVLTARANAAPSILIICSPVHVCPLNFPYGIGDCSSTHRRCLECFRLFVADRVPLNAVALPLAALNLCLQYPAIKATMSLHQKAVKGADYVVSDSEYMAKTLKEWFGRESKVIYHYIDLARVKVQSPMQPKYVTLVSPAPSKGVRIALQVAHRLPQLPFLFVGKRPTFLRQVPPNVSFTGWVEDMREVYQMTKVLIVPSICPEAFGMVCIEAMANGIPCVASRIGGLPESVGDGGMLIEDVHNVAAWVERLSALWNDKALYSSLSMKALVRVAEFDPEKQYRAFESLVNSIPAVGGQSVG